jgi:hypothetical protein
VTAVESDPDTRTVTPGSGPPPGLVTVPDTRAACAHAVPPAKQTSSGTIAAAARRAWGRPRGPDCPTNAVISISILRVACPLAECDRMSPPTPRLPRPPPAPSGAPPGRGRAAGPPRGRAVARRGRNRLRKTALRDGVYNASGTTVVK